MAMYFFVVVVPWDGNKIHSSMMASLEGFPASFNLVMSENNFAKTWIEKKNALIEVPKSFLYKSNFI